MNKLFNLTMFKRGWRMSGAKLFNMDFKELVKKIPNESIDLILTDPPYLHVKGGMKSKKFNTGTWKEKSYMNQEMSDFDKDKIFEFLDLTIPKMKKVNMYIFCSKLQLLHYFEYISLHKKLKFDLLIWDKVKYSMKSTKFFTSDIEYIVRIYESGVSLNKIYLKDGSKSDINYYLKRKAFEQPKGEHGTMKPVELLNQLILLSSKEGDIIFDPFLGSGSTAASCLINKRKFIGSEIDRNYYELAKNRIDLVG